MNPRIVLAAIILLITGAVMAAILLDWVSTSNLIGPFRFSHWMAWIGVLFIAVYAPMYHILKRRSKHAKALLDIHSFGFLIAFLLISIHFAGQMSRPPQSFPELGEGIALYMVILLLVLTGIIQRFGTASIARRKHYTPRFNRLVHISLISAFYIVIVVHAVTNLDLL
jgi:uncharacterized membrane protein YidH (DUF202 family)